jgi:UDP-N-acetylmuramyl pentapeptide phosphotransferase/UDP-N-acetylglucosamine-1-phosphate transferase
MILLLWPLLVRYALVQPNARSSHVVPTPQGGGIAAITAIVTVTIFAAPMVHETVSGSFGSLSIVLAATAFLAVVGMVDDIRTVGVGTRLLLQVLAVLAVIAALPAELRVLPFLSWPVERVLLLLGGLWFINLVNFMDGLDWMTVAEVVPVSGGLVLLGLLGALPPVGVLVALGLFGAILGFAPFNRPVARLFLGDVGTLPIGVLLGWLLILLASNGHIVAALLLPLYYLADATVTLCRRISSGEPVWEAHRTHFYQLATDRGFTVLEVIARVFTANLALAALALVSVLKSELFISICALAVGSGIVGWLLVSFSRGKK